MPGCRKESADSAESLGMGRIEIALSAGDVVFADGATKSGDDGLSLDDIVFTISGQTALGEEIVSQPLTLLSGETSAYCYFAAGEYTITATYAPDGAETDYGAVCYSGTSAEFTVKTGEVTGAVVIEMTPSNARVKLIFDQSLKAFYSTVSVDFTSPRTLSAVSSDADAQGCVTIYLPAGAAGVYGISATPLSNSGSALIGITGLRLPALKENEQPLCLEAGKEYTLKVKFAPGGIAVFIDGESAPVYTTEETWDGLFS